MTTPPESGSVTPPGPAGATGTAGAAGPHGVIHDIGYQHFAGERLGRGYIRRSLFLESVKAAYGIGRSGRSKVMPMLLFAVMCLPAVVMVVVTAATDAPELVGDYTSYVMNLQLVIGIYIAGQAPASVSRDLRYRVVSLYFSRPLERLDYVAAKFAAMAAALLIFIATPLTILFVGALVVGLPLTEQLPDYLRSLGGAVLASLLLAGIGLVIAAVTPRRGLGVAAIITVLLVLAGVQGVAQEMALTYGGEQMAAYLAMLSPFTLIDGVQSALFGASSPLTGAPTEFVDGLVFLAAALAGAAACFWLLLLRYRKVSVS